MKVERTELEIATNDGVARAWAYAPADARGELPGALMIIDALLVRPAMHAIAEHVAGLGYSVLLPDVFYRAGEVAPFDPMTVWGDEKERARLFALLGSISLQTAMQDVGHYLDALAARPHTRATGLGVWGYCMGGRWAFAAAGHHASRIRAMASFHGGNIVTDKPDSPHNLAPKIEAKLYLGVADDDRSCTPEHQATIAQALGAAHVEYTMELYRGKQHGFAVADNAAHDAGAAARHLRRLETFFGETLR